MPELLPIRWVKGVTRPETPFRLMYSSEGQTVMAPPPKLIMCDFCDRVIAPGEARAVFDGVRGKITSLHVDNRGWWIDGPFAACRNCQVRLGIRPGAQEVELAKVRRLFSSEVKRAMSPKRVRAAFYGPG